MIKVEVYKQSGYPVSSKKIKQAVASVFAGNGITSDAEASVALVGQKKITELAMEYLNESKEEAMSHPVLSFPVSEMTGHFVFPPDEKIHLGEIVISYPYSLSQSKDEGKLIDEVVCMWAQHGALHLVGIHHD